jgi:hypothetical protein
MSDDSRRWIRSSGRIILIIVAISFAADGCNWFKKATGRTAASIPLDSVSALAGPTTGALDADAPIHFTTQGDVVADFELNPNQHALDFGTGWNQIDSRSFPTCLTRTTANAGDHSGLHIAAYIDRVKSTQQARSMSEVSVALSAGGVAWSASASASQQQSSGTSADRETLAALIEVVQRPQQLAEITLPDSLARLLQTAPEAFMNLCGTHYVFAMTKGATIRVIMEQKNTEDFWTKRVQREVNGQYGSFSAAGAFESRATAIAQTNAFTSRSVTQGVASVPQSADEWKTAIAQLTTSATNTAYPITAFMRMYNFPAPMIAKLKRVTRSREALETGRGDAIDIRATLQRVIDSPLDFDGPNMSELRQGRVTLTTYIDSLTAILDDCGSDFVLCPRPPQMPAVSIPNGIDWREFPIQTGLPIVCDNVPVGSPYWVRLTGQWIGSALFNQGNPVPATVQHPVDRTQLLQIFQVPSNSNDLLTGRSNIQPYFTSKGYRYEAITGGRAACAEFTGGDPNERSIRTLLNPIRFGIVRDSVAVAPPKKKPVPDER